MVTIIKNGEPVEMTVDEYNAYIGKEKEQITFINPNGTTRGDNQDELSCISLYQTCPGTQEYFVW